MASIVPGKVDVAANNAKATTVVTTTTVAEPHSDRLRVGEKLVLGKSLFSPSGRYEFANKDGGLTLFDGTTSLWTTGERLDTVYHYPQLEMQDDDNLVFSDAWRGSWGWKSATRNRVGGGTAAFIVRDTGDAIITSEGIIIWATRPELAEKIKPKYAPADPNSDRVKMGEYLPVNQPLTSENKQYSTILQEDGNLILRRNPSNITIWSLGTSSKSPATGLYLDLEGKLVMYAADGSQIWTGSRPMVNNYAELIAYDNGFVEIKPKEYQGGDRDFWSNGIRLLASSTPASTLSWSDSLAVDQTLTSGGWQLGFNTHGHIYIQNPQGQKTYYYNHLKEVEGAVLMTVVWSGFLEFKDVQGKVLCRIKRDKYDPRREDVLRVRPGGASFGADVWSTDNWQWTGTTPTPPPGKLHGSKLLPGESLGVGEALVSGNAAYYMVYQQDGNLVTYTRPTNEVKWAADCQGKGEPDKVVLQSNGNLVAYLEHGEQSWSSKSGFGGGDAVFILQNDGNAVVSVDEVPLWASDDQRSDSTSMDDRYIAVADDGLDSMNKPFVR